MQVGQVRATLLAATLATLATLATQVTGETGNLNCSLPDAVKNNILKYKNNVDRIMTSAVMRTNGIPIYSPLRYFVNRFGARPSGSDELEAAIDYMEESARKDGFTVHTEEVMVPHWVRGEESLLMLKPRRKTMSILGLGGTIGTQQYPGGVLRAEAVVVNSFDDMEARGRQQIKGKIVVFNAEFGDPEDEPVRRYASSSAYRSTSAVRAAKLGAVAVLVRSRTDFSLYTPHGGAMSYDNTTTPIPAAAITVEDANILTESFHNGRPVELLLKMSAANLPPRKSRNLLIDLGPADATETVLLSSHIDSWDIGEGAMDNGAGVLVNYYALLLLKKNGLVPRRRRVRLALWTAEEYGNIGGIEYVKRHESDISSMQIVIENDMGAFRPRGLRFRGSDEAGCFVRYVASMFKVAKSTGVAPDPVLSETSLFQERGVPAAALDVDQSRYFWYHHTPADTMDVINQEEMDLCVATMAAAAYVFADVPDRVPR